MDRPINRPYDEIVSYLCLGSKDAEEHYPKFALVVNCTKTATADHPQKIEIPVDDTPDDCAQLLELLCEHEVLERIHACIAAKQPVLVHCRMGMQRSAAVVACYLIKYNYMTPSSAMAFIRFKRPVAFFGGANFERTMHAVATMVFSPDVTQHGSLGESARIALL